MSQENVEIVRELFASWERGDFSSSDWAHPEIEFLAHAGPDEAEHRGVVALGRAWQNWLGAWEDFKVTPREFIDRGDDVLALVEFGGRGRASGVSVEAMAGGCLLSFRNGRVIRLVTFTDRDEALEAAGLRE
jgi:ketosteroid isomerase-like protein